MTAGREDYARSGVNVEAGYAAVQLMAVSVARTRTSGVLSELGGFGGAFALPAGLREPVLVSGTDGVGTKLKLAFLTSRHDTVDIDCMAMCVNDILCSGARPLFFLDYIAVGKNVPERVAAVVSGVAEGCVQAGCALIGGACLIRSFVQLIKKIYYRYFIICFPDSALVRTDARCEDGRAQKRIPYPCRNIADCFDCRSCSRICS